MTDPSRPYGLLAEFGDAAALTAAAQETYAAGYRQIDACAPFPVHGLAEAIGARGTRLPRWVLAGGIAGALAGFGLQHWVSVDVYPLNIGGRPLNSWPAFLPVTFELTILLASLAAVLGMLALNGLPQPWHPLFGVERFARATRDGFFLVIEASDPMFDLNQTKQFLESRQPIGVYEVPQ